MNTETEEINKSFLQKIFYLPVYKDMAEKIYKQAHVVNCSVIGTIEADDDFVVLKIRARNLYGIFALGIAVEILNNHETTMEKLKSELQ